MHVLYFVQDNLNLLSKRLKSSYKKLQARFTKVLLGLKKYKTLLGDLTPSFSTRLPLGILELNLGYWIIKKILWNNVRLPDSKTVLLFTKTEASLFRNLFHKIRQEL